MRVMPDRIETGTYAIAAAIAGGEVELVGARRGHHRRAARRCWSRAAPRSHDTPRGIEGAHEWRPAACRSIVTTAPFPGFPTDLQAQFMALMTMADGTSVIRETIFENRFMHVPELARWAPTSASKAISPSCAGWKSSRARR